MNTSNKKGTKNTLTKINMRKERKLSMKEKLENEQRLLTLIELMNERHSIDMISDFITEEEGPSNILLLYHIMMENLWHRQNELIVDRVAHVIKK